MQPPKGQAEGGEEAPGPRGSLLLLPQTSWVNSPPLPPEPFLVIVSEPARPHHLSTLLRSPQ